MCPTNVVDIHLEVTDAPVDFAASYVDVALRYGDGGYAFAAADRIMNETVTPLLATPGS
jgi:LysR family glycine cleavage system transcriptional activator